MFCFWCTFRFKKNKGISVGISWQRISHLLLHQQGKTLVFLTGELFFSCQGHWRDLSVSPTIVTRWLCQCCPITDVSFPPSISEYFGTLAVVVQNIYKYETHTYIFYYNYFLVGNRDMSKRLILYKPVNHGLKPNLQWKSGIQISSEYEISFSRVSIMHLRIIKSFLLLNLTWARLCIVGSHCCSASK